MSLDEKDYEIMSKFVIPLEDEEARFSEKTKQVCTPPLLPAFPYCTAKK